MNIRLHQSDFGTFLLEEIDRKIRDKKKRRTLLIQSDWDYPGIAGTFGFSLKSVQKCENCDGIITGVDPHAKTFLCDACEEDKEDTGVMENNHPCCDHRTTDGTVDCKDCGVPVGAFISAAGDWMDENDGKTTEDPGYF